MAELLRILLVDDDAVDRSQVRQLLSRTAVQAEFVEVESCAVAMATLRQQKFDCLLLDYQLPDGDGLRLVNQIQAMESKVAVIVLTDRGDEAIAVELMKAGVSDYLLKNNLAAESLVWSVLNAVRLHRAELQAAAAKQQLQASEERYRLVLEGSNDGIWDWYICQNEVFCNDRLFEIIGISRAEFGTAYDAFYRLIHSDDRPRVLRALTAHIQQGASFDVEFRLLHAASGNYRYCTSRGKAQRDPQGNLFRMSGIVSDISDRKQAEAEITKLNRDLQQQIGEMQTLFDVLPIGIAIADDPQCQQVRINATYAEMLGVVTDANAAMSTLQLEQISHQLCRNGQELLPRELPIETAIAKGSKVVNAEMDIQRADGKVIHVLSHTTPLFDEQGKTRGGVGAFLDITDRKRAEAIQSFLAAVSAKLFVSLDATTILQALAEQAVPFLADCCHFDLITSQWRVRRVAWRHTDPNQQDWFDQIQHYSASQDLQQGVFRQLSLGQPVFVPQVSAAWLQATITDPEYLAFLQQLQLRSWIAVPLTVHEQTLGVLTFCFTASSQRTYTAADLKLIEELAYRTAIAVDNAQLYRVTQEAEQNLRQALVILGQHQQQLRTLQRLTDLLNQRLTNLPELLRVMVDAICDAIPNAEFGLMALQNNTSGLLEIIVATGVRLEQLRLDQSFAPGAGVLGEIFQTGQSRCVVHTPLDDSNGSPLPHSLCAVTIESAQAGRLGVLAIGNWSDPQAFNDDDLQLLIAFGEQAAIALTNAKLINALEEREERLAVQNRILAEQNRELEQQRQQIHQQNLQLREAAKLKSQFIATMSHELRTPMNAVIGFSQLLLRQPTLSPQQQDMVQRILNNGRNLLTLINDILDLSKIEAGRLELRLEEVNLATLVSATTEELRSLAQQKNLELTIDLNLSNPQIHNDSTRLRQILVNLLSNAIKFTEVGSVRVIAEEVNPETLALSVQDTGIGIAQANLESIFDEFHQVDQTLAKRFSGTGLGLAITDLLVHLMNGRITVESQLGAGSMFRVEFPRHVTPSTQAKAASAFTAMPEALSPALD